MNGMRLTCRWIAVLCFIAPSAHAAEITDVADAVDEIDIHALKKKDIFDAYVGLRYELALSSGRITREVIDRDGVDVGCGPANPRSCRPLDELSYQRRQHILNVDLQIGMFRDLAFTIGLPIILEDTTSFDYASGVGADNSSIDPNYDITGDGVVSASDQLFPHNFLGRHAGLGALGLGLRWAPTNDERDFARPQWLLAFEWRMPYTMTTYDPAINRATDTNVAPVGDGVHRLKFELALAKRTAYFGLPYYGDTANRRGYLEPYFSIQYIAPIPDGGQVIPALEPQQRFAVSPSHQAILQGGVELVPYEDLLNHRKVAIDLGMIGKYFSAGRNYSILTDALGELTYTDQYFHIGGKLGIVAQVMEYVRIGTGFSLGHNTAHLLTNEEVGEDVNGDRQVIRPEDDPNPEKDELNPYFCGNTPGDTCSAESSGGSAKGQAPYDQVGFRLWNEGNLSFTFWLNVMVTF